jgi:hypothetical protein
MQQGRYRVSKSGGVVFYGSVAILMENHKSVERWGAGVDAGRGRPSQQLRQMHQVHLFRRAQTQLRMRAIHLQHVQPLKIYFNIQVRVCYSCIYFSACTLYVCVCAYTALYITHLEGLSWHVTVKVRGQVLQSLRRRRRRAQHVQPLAEQPLLQHHQVITQIRYVRVKRRHRLLHTRSQQWAMRVCGVSASKRRHCLLCT